MNKIKSITFKKHPILGNTHLDFCDLYGNPVDTVIFAGENGTGKSTILDELYKAISLEANSELSVCMVVDGVEIHLDYHWGKINEKSYIFVDDHQGLNLIQSTDRVRNKYHFPALFSDVDINFQAGNIQSVTSSELDKSMSNQRSSINFPTQIKQLIVDLQASDDSDTAESVRLVGNGSRKFNDIKTGDRMRRFTDAFNTMFDDIAYSKVTNDKNHKSIVFSKYGQTIDIDQLSSGEKQVVYRGCFLLKDKEAMTGAFVFIDEPEISLHPEWQKKILDYYKGIFTNFEGVQTSQLFVATHSPFIIHNENRKNDKVIILKRDEAGEISVLDKPEYYICENKALVLDAFNVHDFYVATDNSVVYVEGRSDEMYLKKAAELFSKSDVQFDIQWVGHLIKNGKNEKEEFSGSSGLDSAVKFMKGRHPQYPQIFLYDCDTNKTETDEDNIIIMKVPYHDGRGEMNKGIENSLVLDNIDIDAHYNTRTVNKDYGGKVVTTELDKISLAKYICSLDNKVLEFVLQDLREIIDKIVYRIRNNLEK